MLSAMGLWQEKKGGRGLGDGDSEERSVNDADTSCIAHNSSASVFNLGQLIFTSTLL